MPLKAGDPAEADDVWLRVITNKDYWRHDGRLHNSAFGGKGGFSPSQNCPWTHELSGRLLSLVQNLRQECIDFCGDRFAGVMFQKVENLRSEDSGWPTDVYYTPKDYDNAHADFVSFKTKDKIDYYEVRDWLQDFIQHVKPDKLEAVEALRPAAAAK
jgi:hypothetical protein